MQLLNINTNLHYSNYSINHINTNFNQSSKTIGRGKDLTKEEQGKISAPSLIGQNPPQISRTIGRSRNAITKFLSNTIQCNIKRTGGSKKLSPHEKRAIFKLASEGKLSS